MKNRETFINCWLISWDFHDAHKTRDYNNRIVGLKLNIYDFTSIYWHVGCRPTHIVLLNRNKGVINSFTLRKCWNIEQHLLRETKRIYTASHLILIKPALPRNLTQFFIHFVLSNTYVTRSLNLHNLKVTDSNEKIPFTAFYHLDSNIYHIFHFNSTRSFVKKVTFISC